MQKLLDALEAKLQAFVAQGDELALVVSCTDEESVVVLKSLEGLDEASASEMFWVVSDEFREARSYVSGVVNAFAVKHGGVRLAMEREGMAPWPSLPAAILDESRRPVDRLRELMMFSRTLLPAPDGFVVAWCLVPLTIGDRLGFASLLAELLRHELPNPWCHHLRFIVRADRADPALPAALRPIPRVSWYKPPLSQEDMQQAMDEEAADPTLPLERRLQNLFMSAGVDYGFQRFGDALQKYGVLLKYYAGTRNETMTALVLNAIGETHARIGNAEQAGECFELAFVPASKAPGPPIPVMLNVVLNLANLRMGQERWAEAEVYYESAHQLATAQRDAGTKVGAIENLGHCQYLQGKVKEALGTWHAGAALAGELELPEQRESMLRRLATYYMNVGDARQYADVERQLAVGSPRVPAPAG
jgi:tetratricopeptide (TPR) repeat protein